MLDDCEACCITSGCSVPALQALVDMFETPPLTRQCSCMVIMQQQRRKKYCFVWEMRNGCIYWR